MKFIVRTDYNVRSVSKLSNNTPHNLYISSVGCLWILFEFAIELCNKFNIK